MTAAIAPSRDTLRRLLPWAVCVLLLAAGAAHAQSPGATAEGDTTNAAGGVLGALAAKADSTTGDAATEDGAETEENTRKFQPTYTTHYGLNRLHTDWSQNLAFFLPVGRLTIEHRTNGTIGRDKDFNKNTTRTERLDSQTSLTYKANDALNFRADWTIPKNLYSDTRGSNRDDKSNLTLGGDFKRERTGVYALGFKAEGGRAQSDEKQTSKDPDRPDAPNRVDLPHGSGLTGTLHGDGTYYAGTALRVTSRYDYNRERLDNRTRIQWSDSTGAIIASSDTTSTTNNSMRTNTLEATLTPGASTQFQLSLSDDSRQDEYYLSLYNGQERHTYAHRGLTASSGLTDGPLRGAFTFTYGHVDDAHTHTASTDVKKTTHRYELKVESWRIWGFDIAGNFADETSDENHPELRPTDTSLDGTRTSHSLDLTLDRTLGKLRLHGASNLSLQRDEFIDSKSDRDVAVRRGAVSGTWTASKKMTLMASYDASERHDVAIAKTRSANNATKQTYLFTPSMTYVITPNTTITEGVQFKSDFTFVDFFENRNYYSGSMTVNSSLISQLSPRVKVEMTHSALVLRKGAYAPLIVDGVSYGRLFSQSNQDRSQELRTTLNYAPGKLKFSLAQRLYFLHSYSACKVAYDRFVCEFDPKSSRRQLSITPQGTITYNFGSGARLSVDVTRYELAGTTEKPYWRIDSSLTKVFFK